MLLSLQRRMRAAAMHLPCTSGLAAANLCAYGLRRALAACICLAWISDICMMVCCLKKYRCAGRRCAAGVLGPHAAVACRMLKTCRVKY